MSWFLFLRDDNDDNLSLSILSFLGGGGGMVVDCCVIVLEYY